MSCTDIPLILRSSGTKGCELTAEKFPGCACELHSVEPCLSPGPVLDSEQLVRFVAPHDYDAELGTIKTSLFAHAGVNGMSVTRLDHTTDDRIKSEQASRGLVGFVTAVCGEVRSIEFNKQQAFAVYDTALPDNKAHADVCQALFTPRSKRSELRKILKERFTVTPKRY